MARKRKRLFGPILGIIILVVAGGIAYSYHKPLPPITVTVNAPVIRPASAVPLAWPSYGQAAVGAVGYGVLATHGSQTPLPTASTAKILTALSVLHAQPLSIGQQGPTLTMTQADVDSYNKYVAEDGSVVPVQVGEQFSEYQALQAMLLPSANNMAETLARWAFGSLDAYTTYANQFAKEQGWTSMTITDPSGFLPTTVASTHDLTLLGELAMQNPVIAEIVAQPYATLPTVGVIHNVNAMLGQSNTIGIKTGNNDQDLGAYMFASQATVGGKTVTVVGAIMNAPSLPRALSDSLPLIVSATGNFSSTPVLNKGEILATYQVPWQGNIAAVSAAQVNAVTWNGDKPNIHISPAKLHGSHPDGSDAGAVIITAQHGSVPSSSVRLQLDSAIKAPSLWWRLTHMF